MMICYGSSMTRNVQILCTSTVTSVMIAMFNKYYCASDNYLYNQECPRAFVFELYQDRVIHRALRGEGENEREDSKRFKIQILFKALFVALGVERYIWNLDQAKCPGFQLRCEIHSSSSSTLTSVSSLIPTCTGNIICLFSFGECKSGIMILSTSPRLELRKFLLSMFDMLIFDRDVGTSRMGPERLPVGCDELPMPMVGVSRMRPSLSCRNTRHAIAFWSATFGMENIACKTGGTEGVRMSTIATMFIWTVTLLNFAGICQTRAVV